MYKVLISDNIAEEGKAILRETEGLEVDDRPGISPSELLDVIGEYDGLIVRSRTKVTAEVIDRAERLKAVARAGVGVDNIDVSAATRRGIVVMNTPGGNTVSTAEHAVAMMFALARNIPQACADMKQGNWNRKKFVGVQLTGKTLGIVGLGRVGLEVARRAVGLEMRVLGYDPYVSGERAKSVGLRLVDTLEELLPQCDYITIHAPLTDETRNLISKEEISLMKDGVRIINCARGGIVDEDALAEALRSGKVAGAALDVFSKEPPEDWSLVQLDNVIATPHIAASTVEAQVNVAIDAARQLVDALVRGVYRYAVNLPAVEESVAEFARPYLLLAERIGMFHRQLARGRIGRVVVTVRGHASEVPLHMLRNAVLVGLLRASSEKINVVNAAVVAEERGIKVTESATSEAADYSNLVDVRVRTVEGKERQVAGSLLGKDSPRIVSIDGYRTDLASEGDMIVVFGRDVPGFIGTVGADLAERGINIAGMTNARKEPGGEAICVLNLDSPPLPDAVEHLRNASCIDEVYVVKLADED